jgi:hypothetical protein
VVASATTVTTTPAQTDNQITVLAFICRMLPKAPDPDPALVWSA